MIYIAESCKCFMDLNTQIWSMNKEIWNSHIGGKVFCVFVLNLTVTLPFLAQKFTSQFGIIKGFGCSVPVNRSTVVFIGGHYMEVRLKSANQGVHFTHYDYIPLKWPINDQVFQFSFLTRNWTELPKVPDIQVCLAK